MISRPPPSSLPPHPNSFPPPRRPFLLLPSPPFPQEETQIQILAPPSLLPLPSFLLPTFPFSLPSPLPTSSKEEDLMELFRPPFPLSPLHPSLLLPPSLLPLFFSIPLPFFLPPPSLLTSSSLLFPPLLESFDSLYHHPSSPNFKL